MKIHRLIPIVVLMSVVAILIAGCGPVTTVHHNKNVAGVRARMYTFFRDEKNGNAEAACHLLVRAAQTRLAKEEGTSTCPAAFFKIWNTSSSEGVLTEKEEVASDKRATTKDEAEIAKRKILVVGDNATAIDPELHETEEYIYSNGEWLFVKQSSNTMKNTEEFEKQAKETEAKNRALLEAAEAQENREALRQQGG